MMTISTAQESILAHVYNNLTNKSAFQDSGILSAKEQKALLGGYPPEVKAYSDSVAAVNEAAHSLTRRTGLGISSCVIRPLGTLKEFLHGQMGIRSCTGLLELQQMVTAV